MTLKAPHRPDRRLSEVTLTALLATEIDPPAEDDPVEWEQPPSLDSMVRMVATLGGFLDRTRDGLPGGQSLWIGLQRAADFVLALEAQRAVSGSYG